MAVVYEEVSQCVYGMVVEAVFKGQLTGGVGVRIVVTLHCFYKALASRRDYESALAGAGANGPANQLNTLKDAASSGANGYA